MGFVEITSELWSFLDSVCRDEGLRLYDAKLSGNNKLTVFIDSQSESGQEESKGATADDCYKLCKRLQGVFLVDGFKYGLSSDPNLEVFTPGIERELRLLSQYQEAQSKDEKIKVSIREVVEGSNVKLIVGNIDNITDLGLSIKVGDSSLVNVGFDNIKWARVFFEF